jgi:ER lumen protein retaining receptor
MNSAFRVAGDVSSVLSGLFLIHHIRERKSSEGISFKTQSLYLVSFIARWIADEQGNAPSWRWSAPGFFFASCSSLLLIALSLYIVYLVKWAYKSEATHKVDTFRSAYLVLGALILALFFNEDFNFYRDVIAHNSAWSYRWAYFSVFPLLLRVIIIGRSSVFNMAREHCSYSSIPHDRKNGRRREYRCTLPRLVSKRISRFLPPSKHFDGHA